MPPRPPSPAAPTAPVAEPTPGVERRIRTTPWLGPVLLALGSGLALAHWVHPWFDPTNDGSIYLLTARALAGGEGYTYNGVPFRVRPPGFAWLLSLLMRVRGTDFAAINLLVASFGALAVLGLCVFARHRTGAPLAFAAALVVGTSPGFLRLANQPMSDVPGLALLFLVFGLERWSDRRASLRRELLLGLAIGLFFYVRTAIFLVLPALLVARTLGRLAEGSAGTSWRALVGKRLLPVSLACLLVLGAWPLRNALNPTPSPADQTRHYSYSVALWHADQGDPDSPRVPLGEVLARVPERSRDVLSLLGRRLSEGELDPASTALGLALSFALLWNLVRRRRTSEIFACLLFAAVAIAFSLSGRHVLPLFALGVLNAVEVLGRGLRQLLGRPGPPLGAAVLLLAAALGADPRRGWPTIREAHRQEVERARKIDARLEEGARLGAPRGWLHAVYLERPVVNLAFAVERAGSPRAAEELIDRYRLDTVLTGAERASDQDLRRYLEARYPSQRVAGVHLFRVRERAILPSD